MDTDGGRAMKFLNVRDLRGKSAQVWQKLLAKREMMITSNTPFISLPWRNGYIILVASGAPLRGIGH
jgi:hypothetical protein